jgi:prepilin-type N-terminal cleavage/methylation domain-containing protein
MAARDRDPQSPRTSARPRGFSLVEVLVAVVVSAVGFAAVFALQIRTMQGNISAREQAAAMVLAESGLETLRTESYRWRTEALPAGLLAAAPRTWHALTDQPVDHTGLPLNSNAIPGSELNRQRFCVHYWLEPLDGTFSQLLNLRVRVVWPRATNDVGGLAAMCSEAGAAAFVPRNPDSVQRWNSVTLPGALRMRE